MLRGKENPPFTRHKVKVLGTPRLIDITKATQELKYTPRYTYTTTIDDTVSWYRTLTQGSSIEATKIITMNTVTAMLLMTKRIELCLSKSLFLW